MLNQAPDAPFEFEERARVIGKAILDHLDIPLRISDTPNKKIVVEFTSVMPKCGKTTQTQLLSSSMRAACGKKLKVVIMPEGAEDKAIRAMDKNLIASFQARHLSYVMQNLLDLAWSREFHLAVLDRSIIDHLIWQEYHARNGGVSREHRNKVWEYVLSGEWVLAVDAIYFLDCDVETAMNREKGNVSLERTGSLMNADTLKRISEAAEPTIQELKEKMPSLNIFKINTAEYSEKKTNEIITSTLLEVLYDNYKIEPRRVIPYSLSMMRREAKRSGNFEATIKFRGHPSELLILKNGWSHKKTIEQFDNYYLFKGASHPDIQPGEIIRIRTWDGQYVFSYKGVGAENIILRRPHLHIPIDESQMKELTEIYDKLVSVNKRPRKIYEKEVQTAANAENRFYLHIDNIEELESFSELSMSTTDYDEARQIILEEAELLGFKLTDIVEGNYLKMAIEKSKKAVS